MRRDLIDITERCCHLSPHPNYCVHQGSHFGVCPPESLNIRLLKAEYDPRIAASRFTVGFVCDWVNHQRTVTITATQGQLQGGFGNSSGGLHPNKVDYYLFQFIKK